MRKLWSIVLVLALALLSSCSGGDSPTDPGPTTDSVVVESFEPALGVLAPGSRVTFRARIRYALASAGTGRIVIVIQDQLENNISPTQPQPNAQVTQGFGTVELADTITIPATGVTSVRVFYPLFPTGAPRATVVQSVVYSVR